PERKEPRPYRKVDPRRDQDQHQEGKPEAAPAGQRDADDISPEYIIDSSKDRHIFILSFLLMTGSSHSVQQRACLRSLIFGTIPLSVQYITKSGGCKTIYCITAFICYSIYPSKYLRDYFPRIP